MIRLDELLCGGAFRLFEGERLDIRHTEPAPLVAAGAPKLSVVVAPDAAASLVLLYDRPLEASVEVELGRDAHLELCVLFTAEAFVEVEVRQQGRRECHLTTLQLAGSNLVCRVRLQEPGASNTLHGAFLAGAGEHCVADIRIDHAVSDCRSESCVKGVASGDGVGEFRGLVYVAPDAQRTDARQTSRNVVLGDAARITTRPQLEIYADDVKCSHGSRWDSLMNRPCSTCSSAASAAKRHRCCSSSLLRAKSSTPSPWRPCATACTIWWRSVSVAS